MIHQLRIYEIFEHNKSAFHERFRQHAMRIMHTYGFEILAIWETRAGDRTEFVYLLAWPDEETMRNAWTRFRENEEWKEIKRLTAGQHGDLVGEIQERVLTPLSYSPQLL
jgi:heme-degrading monooxygenase HmoA